MNADEKATSEFALRIAVLLALRLALSIITVWCFAWGTVVLILRVAFATPRPFLLWGLAGVLPAAVLAFILARRRIPKHGSVRALLDMHSRCGGLFMAAGDVDIGDWRTRMPVVGAPRLSWHSGRSWALLAAAGLFLLVGFLVPQRLVTTPSAGALEIDEEIDKLADQIEILQEEEILEPEKAEAILEKLEQLRTEASGEDPVKTWEALDHLEGIPKQAAKEAAEAAIRETERLTRAETLAEGLLEEGAAMEPKLMAEAMSALAQMVEKAAEETELCKRRLTRKDLLKACEAGTISPEQLKEMANALYLSKEDLSALLEKLCEADLLDLEAINLNAKIGECDCEGLAAFLEQNAGKMSVGKMVALWCEGKPGRGGVTRGRGDAPMIWGDETSEEGAKFEEEALPPGAITSMKESGLIGVSMGAPTEEGAGGPSESGALSGATAGGGSAFTQNVLPRHRGTVERYFERE